MYYILLFPVLTSDFKLILHLAINKLVLNIYIVYNFADCQRQFDRIETILCLHIPDI